MTIAAPRARARRSGPRRGGSRRPRGSAESAPSSSSFWGACTLRLEPVSPRAFWGRGLVLLPLVRFQRRALFRRRFRAAGARAAGFRAARGFGLGGRLAGHRFVVAALRPWSFAPSPWEQPCVSALRAHVFGHKRNARARQKPGPAPRGLSRQRLKIGKKRSKYRIDEEEKGGGGCGPISQGGAWWCGRRR